MTPAALVRHMRLFTVRSPRKAHPGDVFNGARRLYCRTEDVGELQAFLTGIHFARFKAIELGEPAREIVPLDDLPKGHVVGVRDSQVVFMISPPAPEGPKLPPIDVAALEARGQ